LRIPPRWRPGRDRCRRRCRLRWRRRRLLPRLRLLLRLLGLVFTFSQWARAPIGLRRHRPLASGRAQIRRATRPTGPPHRRGREVIERVAWRPQGGARLVQHALTLLWTPRWRRRWSRTTRRWTRWRRKLRWRRQRTSMALPHYVIQGDNFTLSHSQKLRRPPVLTPRNYPAPLSQSPTLKRLYKDGKVSSLLVTRVKLP
jgi:hypothetical protein